MPGLPVPAFPADLLKEARMTWELTGNVLSGGQATTGVTSLAQLNSDGGLWRAQLSQIKIWTADQRRCWRAVSAKCDGGIQPMTVYVREIFDEPFPTVNGALFTGQDGVRFSDGSLFADGAGLHSGAIEAYAMGPASLYATSLAIRMQVGNNLQGGEYFSIDHFTARWRLYRVASAVQGTYPAFDTAGMAGGNDKFTKVLLHLDGASGGTSIVDSNFAGISRTWTAVGNAQLDGARSKFGTSLVLDGVGDYVMTSPPAPSPDVWDLSLGTSDFTIDFWFYRNGNTGIFEFLTGQSDPFTTPSAISFAVFFIPGDTIRFQVNQGATGFFVDSTSTFPPTSNLGWHHVAAIRSGNTLKLFIDGVQEGGNVSFSGAVNSSAFPLSVGTLGQHGNVFKGWIDEYRISMGIARWSANFVPPSFPYDLLAPAGLMDGNDSYTKILMHFNSGFTDDSVGGSARFWVPGSFVPSPDVSDGPVLDSTQWKFGGGSIRFDGFTYIFTADSTDFTLGSSDFTVDFWFRCNDAGGSPGRICGQIDSGASFPSRSIQITRASTNFMVFTVGQGGAAFSVTGTTPFTSTINPGWHHCACVRFGDILKLFIDGTQEGGDVSFTGSINDSSNQFAIGRLGEQASNGFIGWIDEFRLSVGIARWTANFTPPTLPYAALVNYVTFRPPLREAVNDRTEVIFDAPCCTMRLANVSAMDLTLEPPYMADGSLELIEAMTVP